MLEAQFRDAGCKLNDLDLDAQDSLKAMDPPCREAAVKVSSVTYCPCPCHAVLIQNSKLMVSDILVSESAILHCTRLSRAFCLSQGWPRPLARLTPCYIVFCLSMTHTQSMTHTHNTHTQLYLSADLRKIRNKSAQMTSIIARVCSQTRKLSLSLFNCHLLRADTRGNTDSEGTFNQGRCIHKRP